MLFSFTSFCVIYHGWRVVLCCYVSRLLAMHFNLVVVLYIQGSKLATLPRPDSAVEVLLIGELLLL